MKKVACAIRVQFLEAPYSMPDWFLNTQNVMAGVEWVMTT